MTGITRRLVIGAVACAALAACVSASGAPANRTAPAATTATATTTTITIAPPKGGPPKYPWGYGDPLICGPARPAETREASNANKFYGPLALDPAARKERIVLLGDSSACSFLRGLSVVEQAQHITGDQGVVFGCGVVSNKVTTTRREAVGPHSERCKSFVDWTIPKAMSRTRPTIVLWMSVWEKSDLVVRGGRVLIANTPEWMKEIMRRMDAALALFSATGARLVMVTEPAPAPNPNRSDGHIDIKADDAGYVRLNKLLRAFRQRHPDTVTLIDLAAKVCPGGPPCPARVEGLKARPDSRHYTPTAAVWASRWLLAQMFPKP